MPLVRKAVQALSGYTPGEQPRDPGVIKLNTNENPYACSPRVGEALAALVVDRLRLYPDPVALALRARIAALHGCAAANVFAGNGSDEVLALCTRAFVADDGSVGFFQPSYSLYPVLSAIRDVEQRPVELADDFGWRMPPDYTCSLFFLARPNAPTGTLYPKATVQSFCAAQAGVVLIDEAYVDFARDDCADLALGMPNVLVARTLSKSYSLAGLRLGYALGPAPLVEALYKIKDSYNLDALTQALALAALEDPDAMRANAQRIKATRTRLEAALRDRGFTVYPSEANFVWVRPPGDAQDCFDRLRQHRILVRYFEGPRTRDCLRITIGTDKDIDTLLGVLSEEKG